MSEAGPLPEPLAGRRVMVVGGGAVGSFLAGMLARSGFDVVLVDRHAGTGPTVDAIEIVAPDGRRSRAPIERVGSVGAVTTQPSLIVLAVKMFDLPAAIDACAIWPEATILTIQNGVGAEDEVVARRPASGAIAASVTTPIELGPAGAIQWRSRGGIALAPVRGPGGGWIDDLLAAFARVGLPSRRIADARAMKWSKLVANLVGNATSALLDRDPAEVYADPALFRIERRQLREALAVMRGLGVPVVALPGADVRLLALAVRLPEPLSRAILRRVVGGARGGKMPSLRRHLREGAGPSEVGWLNGAVAREGERLGLPVPVNRSLVELVGEAIADPAARARLVGRADLIAAAVSAAVSAADGGLAEGSH